MIPEKAQGKVRQAKVVAAGPGAFDQVQCVCVCKYVWCLVWDKGVNRQPLG